MAQRQLKARLFLISVIIVRFTDKIGIQSTKAGSAWIKATVLVNISFTLTQYQPSSSWPVNFTRPLIVGIPSGEISKIVWTIAIYILMKMKRAACENNINDTASIFFIRRNTISWKLLKFIYFYVFLESKVPPVPDPDAVVYCRSSIISGSMTLLSTWSSILIIIL